MDKVTAAIKEYVQRESTDYAIMIDGEWGIGKTTYYLSQIAKWLDDKKDYTSIYISLYGLSSLDQVSKKILAGRWVPSLFNKFAKTKSGQFSTELGSALVSTALLNLPPEWKIVKIPKLNIDLSKLLLFDDKTVICFDDLERSKINVEELFGYVNGFVERDGLKVIFIANEKDILAKHENKVRYLEIKEKVIRFTLKFQSHTETIMPELINETIKNDQDLQNFLLINSDRISSYCRSVGALNMRMIKHALEMFGSIWAHVHDKASVSEELKFRLFFFTISIVNEHMSGKLDVSKFQEYDNQQFKLLYNMLKDQRNEENTHPIIMYVDKYFGYEGFSFSRAIIGYVCDGYLDAELLNDEIRTLLGTKAYTSIEDRLMYAPLSELSDREFETAITQILNKVTQGKYSVHFYSQLFPTMAYFTRLGLINTDLSNLKNMFLDGASRAYEHSKYLRSELVEIRNTLNAEGLSQEEKRAYLELKEFVNTLNLKLREKFLKQLATSMEQMMVNNFEAFCRKISDYEDEIMNYPVLNRIDTESIFKQLMVCTNHQLYLFQQAIATRYKHLDSMKELMEEKEALEKLRSKIRNVTNSVSQIKLSTFYLNQIASEIDIVLTRDKSFSP
ncbi:hypothetical protein DNHGIG_40360 [Collibacillus ludicampi]|uniref:KAP NTPase domain-containing protein n=1 Tax=Collibacillus ludicampi TaxID=2771369 RepID=A0AAV4LKV8_9BACL|nr:P-loop NTPase fold protein [Collibacillus ludicampi]GIM48487.1 hypothetical protein DNHGIG_40360 [Collibacillus ludicampi]